MGNSPGKWAADFCQVRDSLNTRQGEEFRWQRRRTGGPRAGSWFFRWFGGIEGFRSLPFLLRVGLDPRDRHAAGEISRHDLAVAHGGLENQRPTSTWTRTCGTVAVCGGRQGTSWQWSGPPDPGGPVAGSSATVVVLCPGHRDDAHRQTACPGFVMAPVALFTVKKSVVNGGKPMASAAYKVPAVSKARPPEP
jgi:hypothetical protein